jgi:hypothetical protein
MDRAKALRIYEESVFKFELDPSTFLFWDEMVIPVRKYCETTPKLDHCDMLSTPCQKPPENSRYIQVACNKMSNVYTLVHIKIGRHVKLQVKKRGHANTVT